MIAGMKERDSIGMNMVERSIELTNVIRGN
jgi:hypothetical protein